MVRVDDLIKDVRPGFGLRKKRILDGISFRVREREIFGFIGPNGAGKTTTLKVLMGLIRPTSGQASILGHDVSEVAFRRQIGFLPEQPYFYDYLTGCELLRFYAKLSGVSPRRREGRVTELLELVGLSEAGKTRLRNYSKGMLQRIGIAQALVHDPQVVFLDEPMSGLDPVGRKEVRDIILRLRTEGKTVFMNTHILSDVEMVCDRVAIIANGKIRYEGAIDEYLDAGEPEADLVFANLSAEAAVRLEERFGARLRGHGERIELRIAEKDASEVLRVALDASAEVISVTPHRVSLESIFLSTVNEADAEEDSR
ncbi:MAG: ABC transporter ATP-binding protein [Myxococcales bacterium]|nr:ABC transporter ATP-binding protein [Myxococcales bacterium]